MTNYLTILFIALMTFISFLFISNNSFSDEDKPKVNKTESGLQYIIIKEGYGPKPKPGQRVKVHYSGKLENGQEFDSSYKRDEPFEFTLGVGQVIKGWDEGITYINQGGKGKLIIPPDLGYGERGAGSAIPPNSTLIFDVEVVDIN